jgi:hypothetical protein
MGTANVTLFAKWTSETDTTPPTVIAFDIPATATSLTVPITTFTASESGVSYFITEFATKPVASVPGWSTNKPTSYTFDSDESVYFEVTDGTTNTKNKFIIRLEDTVKIQQARNIIALNNKVLSVMGTIVKEPISWNPAWSYHLLPSSISFFETATEVCDANAQYVEDILNDEDFLPQNRWCPWASYLIREVE